MISKIYKNHHMTDALEKREKALEDQYFAEQEKRALERLKKREQSGARLSPVSGKPMKQITIAGVVVDQCEDSKGIFLDAGELEQILEHTKNSHSWISTFFGNLLGK